jgi:hypothetical protein
LLEELSDVTLLDFLETDFLLWLEDLLRFFFYLSLDFDSFFLILFTCLFDFRFLDLDLDDDEEYDLDDEEVFDRFRCLVRSLEENFMEYDQ